jgi:hypothetical protein
MGCLVHHRWCSRGAPLVALPSLADGHSYRPVFRRQAWDLNGYTCYTVTVRSLLGGGICQ